MACWSAENATKAYLKSLKLVSIHIHYRERIQRTRVRRAPVHLAVHLTRIFDFFKMDGGDGRGQKANEPDVVEFVSALAAGNNAQLMVVACSGAADYTTLALVAAAQQTGGRVVCILRGNEELHMSEKVLGVTNLRHIDFVIGEAQSLVLNCYKEADFVVIDCNLENHEGILRAVQMGKKQNGAVVVGTNAFAKGSWQSGGAKTQLLPIGGGLLVTRIAASSIERRRSQWVVKVDKCTGEEHVFRVRFPQVKGIQA